eukprot:jgi/Chlat1/6308/Chrsp44S00455
MFEVQAALDSQKEDFSRKEEVFRRREEGLKKKDLELQESLIRFSKFLQENDSKRTRAEKKAQDEVKVRLQKESEIERLEAQLEDLKGERLATSNIVEQNMRYQKSVLEAADEYHEINDLLLRHATLEAANGDLTARAAECSAMCEELRAEMQAYSKVKMDEILSLNNTVSRLKKELEHREREAAGAQARQARRDAALGAASSKTRELGCICMATENLFARCKQRSKVSHPDHQNTVDQLTVIGDFMGDLVEIVKTNSGGGGRGGGVGGEVKASLPAKTAAVAAAVVG